MLLVEVLEHFKNREEIVGIALEHARKHVVCTVPTNLHSEGHVWPRWSQADLRALFDSLTVCQPIVGGKYLIAVHDVR